MTGKTPNRNHRSPDERWWPALAKAMAEGRFLSDVIDDALDAYIEDPLPPRTFTLAHWPEAAGWAAAHRGALDALAGDLVGVAGELPAEWLAVAAWMTVTHHPASVAQQGRVITGHIVLRAVTGPEGAWWRSVHRDAGRLTAAVLEAVTPHLPLDEEGQAGAG